MTEWFERWFGEEYLHLYPHRDDEEAERVAALLLGLGAARPGAPTLDLACGPGRHAAALRARGVPVVGLDLSKSLLLAARGRVPLVRGDMRALPFGAARFDTVVNLFTSFGYFARDEEHLRVLREVARVLRPGGRFVLDYLNAPAVRSRLVHRDERELEAGRVVQERAISEDGRFVVKSIHLVEDGRSFVERVRLFDAAELEALLGEAGLRVESRCGDYGGGPHTRTSDRLVLLARRP